MPTGCGGTDSGTRERTTPTYSPLALIRTEGRVPTTPPSQVFRSVTRSYTKAFELDPSLTSTLSDSPPD
jgi:hypothetical protein